MAKQAAGDAGAPPMPSTSDQALRDQTKALQSVLDSLGDGVVVVDRHGKFLLTNPAARRILRMELVETEPELWSERYGCWLPDTVTPYPPRDLPLPRAIRGEAVDASEIFMRHPGAPEGVWLSVTARPLLDDKGRLKGGVAVFRDISDRKRAESERVAWLAREQAARLQAEETVRVQRATEERLKLLVDASGVLLGSLNLESMLPAILELARKMISADAYAIWHATPGESGEWRMLCSSGLSERCQNATIRHMGPREILEAPLAFEDVEAEPLLDETRELLLSEGIRSLAVIPLQIHGVNSGSISFYSRTPRRFDDAELRAASALANLAAAAIASAELYQEQSRMRAEAQDAERRSGFLAEATQILGSSLDYETTLAQVARLAVPHVADWCAIDMLDSSGAIRQLALAHADASKVEWARELTRRYPADPDAPAGAAQVLRTGEPDLVPDIPDSLLAASARDEEHLRLLRQVGFTSSMCVPVPARGRTLGAITFVSAESGRRYGPADLELARHLGRRAGLAIDNARLFETAQRDRAAAEASLVAFRRSEARLRRLMESGIIGIILGEGDTITEANDIFLQIVGRSREELAAGKLRYPSLTAPEYAALDVKKQQEVLAYGACAPYEKEYIRKDGARVPVLLGAALLEELPRFAWVCFVLDLTERKRLEQRLRDSQKLEGIGLLAGGVAHDFNNLLTGILGNASLALDDLPPDSPLRPIIQGVVRASERAADLTRQLLAYSGRGRFVIQPVNLSALVREISSLLLMSIPKKVQLRLDLDDGLPLVEADSSQIQQLIMNLVLNAAEAIGDRIGTVLVTTGVQDVDENYVRSALLRDEINLGRYVYLEVHDTGCGMDEDTKSRIFDPFFTTKFTGRGLGLAAALGIVRGHLGDIEVYSRPGRGSTFKVLLPTSAAALELPEPAPLRQELRGSGTILVVDDEEIVRYTGKAALERFGYQVLLAENGQQAVEVFREAGDRVSLVLLDMTMPVMSGEETLEQLQRIRPDVRVIVSSGYNEVEAIRRFTGTGVAAFIQKPYTSAQLAERVKLVLEGGETGFGSLRAAGHR